MVIHADGADLNVKCFDSQLLHDFTLDRLARFRAETPDALLVVVATQRGKVHAGDSAEHPGDLPVLFHGPACHQGGGAALDRAGVHANLLQPIQIQRSPAIRRKGASVQQGDGGRTSAVRGQDAMALPVRNFKPRSVLGVHSLSPDWEASLYATEAEHITAPASIHHAAATCLRFGAYRSRIPGG